MSIEKLKLHDLKTRDLHVHTLYCNHAEGRMEEYIWAAVRQGLREIGFLAHVEAGVNSSRRLWLRREDLDVYWREGNELRGRYADRIKVSLGLEVGLNPGAISELKQILSGHPWDHVGLSYHFVPDGDSLLNICSRASANRLKEVDAKEINKVYYQALGDHLAEIKPDFLCHFDVVRKFMADVSTDPEIRMLINRLLMEMARLGVAMEVNTAGCTTVGAPYPAPWILNEAIHLGIELVLGSDSHKPEQVGRRFDEALHYIEDSFNTAPRELSSIVIGGRE
jgi:histidinol-phosphatase (PHP family)